MLASHNWLKELTGIDASAEKMAERLTSAGITIDGIAPFARGFDKVVIAEVRGKRAHPSKDKLSLVEVFDGEAQYELVCGAPNVPAPGGRVLLAKVGTKMPNGVEIAERAVAGVTSRGMLCSEAELGIGAESDGIVVLADNEPAQVGQPFAKALGLEDFIFDVSLTPNRPDCLGHIGIARELAALFGVPFAPKLETASLEFSASGPFSVSIDDAERCPQYIGAIVRGASPRVSPIGVRARLFSLGSRSINAIVDATNWVLLEEGHPTHAFDLNKLRDQRVVVRRAKAGEKLASLDGVERELSADDLVIADGQGAVAIAGVMGGKNSEVADGTQDVLLECAYFEPRGVRRTSRRLGLHTDASHRFERGVDPTQLQHTMKRLAARVVELGGGTLVTAAADVHPRAHTPIELTMRHARLALILGTAVPAKTSREILERVGFAVLHADDAGITVRVPGHRPDVLREIDLIEEVARLVGYDNLQTQEPRVSASTEGTSYAIRFARALKERATAIGLDEAVNYSFLAPHELDAVHAPKARVALANPLSEERSVLRTSLLAGLAAALGRAQRHQVDGARLFEIARVFHASDDVLPREEKKLGVLLAGARASWLGDTAPVDAYDLKGVLQSLLEPATLCTVSVQSDQVALAQEPAFHPRRAGIVLVDGKRVGTMGELHPDLIERLSLIGRPVYAELSMQALLDAASGKGVKRFAGLSRFPSVSRDVALLIDESVAVGDLLNTVPSAWERVQIAASVFDIYRGQGVAVGKKSVALRFVYSDPDATLTEDRVEGAHTALLQKLSGAHGVALRA